MTDRELMQMALDNLESLVAYIQGGEPDLVMQVPAIEALRAGLAQPEQEPVAWVYQHKDTGLTMCVLVQQVESGFEKNNPRWQKSTPLYTAPPQREWQGLTNEDRMQIWEATVKYVPGELRIKEFACSLESLLKEKNGG